MKKQRRTALGALALSMAMVATACAGTDASSNAGGEGVEYGASLETYKEAFADVKPIKLKVQTFGGPGASTSIDFEKYMEAVTEWSDGKITFEVNYSSSVAPATEVQQALVDGRLDIAYIFPGYVADQFPINASYSAISILGNKEPILGTLSPYLWMTKSFYNFKEHTEEYEKSGLHALLPVLATNIPVVACTKPLKSLSDFKGKMISATSKARVMQAEALGMTAVTLSYQEAYEGLQRGVVDCTVSSAAGAVLGGLTEVAPYILTSNSVAITTDILPFMVSLDTWKDLPLVAQQLLFDRLDVIIAEDVHAGWSDMVTLAEAAKKHGGSFTAISADAEAALDRANKEILDWVRKDLKTIDGAALVEFGQKESAAADAKVKELGYDQGVGYLDFPGWYERDKIDLKPFVEHFFNEVLLPHRPQ